MDLDKLQQDARALTIKAKDRQRTQIVAPTVTRRPALDAMLSNIAFTAQHQLELMRNLTADGELLPGRMLSEFKELSELVLKTARLEMAVEKHVEERTAILKDAEIAGPIVEKLNARLNLPEDTMVTIVNTVLEVLQLEQD